MESGYNKGGTSPLGRGTFLLTLTPDERRHHGTAF